MTDGHQVISNVVMIGATTPIREGIALMRERRISCLLITGAPIPGGKSPEDDQLVGIVTERDIVWKVVDLDVVNKLDHPLSTIMSRGISFARLKHLRQDIQRLHIATKIRHFPVLVADEPLRRNVIGIMTTTDLYRAQLMHGSGRPQHRPGVPTPAEIEALVAAQAAPTVLLASADPKVQAEFSALYGALGLTLAPVTLEDLRAQAVRHLLAPHNAPASALSPMVIDMDGGAVADLIPILKFTKATGALVILLTSDPRLVMGLRQHLTPGTQHVALKPIDISYVHWLLSKALLSAPH